LLSGRGLAKLAPRSTKTNRKKKGKLKGKDHKEAPLCSHSFHLIKIKSEPHRLPGGSAGRRWNRTARSKTAKKTNKFGGGKEKLVKEPIAAKLISAVAARPTKRKRKEKMSAWRKKGGCGPEKK